MTWQPKLDFTENRDFNTFPEEKAQERQAFLYNQINYSSHGEDKQRCQGNLKPFPQNCSFWVNAAQKPASALGTRGRPPLPPISGTNPLSLIFC